MIRLAFALTGLALCTACAAPVPLTVAALMADGVSYATTEKSISDHGFSALAEQDCAMHRIFTDGPVCSENETFEPGQTIEQPGVYMVMASSYDLQYAKTINEQHAAMKPQLFVMPTGNLVSYHVISGPVTRESYPAAQQLAAKHGITKTWALKIDESDWQLARVLEQSRTQAMVTN